MGSIRVSLNDAGNINLEKARELAAAVKPLVSRQDTYMDQRFYPGADIDVDLQIMYFMAMVSIDHRLTVPGFQYETEINGGSNIGEQTYCGYGVACCWRRIPPLSSPL